MNYPDGTVYDKNAPWNELDHWAECPMSPDFEPDQDFLWQVYEAAQGAWDRQQVGALRLLDCQCDEVGERMAEEAEARRYPEI